MSTGLSFADCNAVLPTSNRLAITKTSTNPSRVSFSGAGDPLTFGATDYVEMFPGDGESIVGMATFRELLVVFKSTKFFVVYGTSPDAVGGVVFNYRPSDSGVGLASRRGLAVAPEAVYFLDRRGIYRTTGSDPVLVSGPIDPIFRGGASSFYQGGALNHAQIALCAMTWHDERLYFAFPSGSSTYNDRLAVYDPRADYWTLWNIPAAAVCPFRIGSQAELVFSYATGSNHVGRHSTAYTSDDGTAISSRYRTGFYDLGHTAQKKIRETRVWGTGTPTYKMSTDFGALGTGETLTLGTAPAIAATMARTAEAGHLFSHEFSATSAWRAHRVAHHLSPGRPESATT